MCSHTGRNIITGSAGNARRRRGADTFLFRVEPVEGQDWWVTIKNVTSGTERIGFLDVFRNIDDVVGPLGTQHFHIGRTATAAKCALSVTRCGGCCGATRTGRVPCRRL